MSIDKTSGNRQRLRRFGFTVAIGFTLIGGLSWWRGHAVVPTVLWTLALLGGGFALAAPVALAPTERVWLAIGHRLAWMNTRIILTVVFYVVVTPIGVVMRLFRDPLDRELSEGRSTYWIRRAVAPFDAKAYQRQF